MLSLLNTAVLGYLAGAGAVANATIVTRGLFRAARRAAEGRYRDAGVEALAALASPTVLAVATTATMVTDVVAGAYDLLGPALDRGEDEEEEAAPKLAA